MSNLSGRESGHSQTWMSDNVRDFGIDMISQQLKNDYSYSIIQIILLYHSGKAESEYQNMGVLNNIFNEQTKFHFNSTKVD